MNVAPDRSDLRTAVPAAVVWVAAAFLVGVPQAAWRVSVVSGAVAAVALVVIVVGGAADGRTAGRIPAAPVGPVFRVTAALLVTTGLLVGLVAVAVAVGDARRRPAALSPPPAGAVPVLVVLDRDLAAADRSVLGTLHTVGESAGLDVPVRIVPSRDDRRHHTLGAGATLSGPAQIEPDEPGSSTAFVLFLRTPTAVTDVSGLLGATNDLRASFAAVTSRLPQPGGALLRGLAIGDRSGLDPTTASAMETSALTHLTAVSGSNCAVVVALAVLSGRALGLGRVPRAACAVVLLLGFVVLVRPDPSIVRATVMAIVALVVHLVGRPVRGVPLIGLAAVGMLVVDPWSARSFAFGLSVLATSGIVVLAPPLSALLGRRCWTPVAAALAVPIAAQVACWPLTIPLAPALPTYAVPANLLTEPLAPVVTVLGLGSCVLAPVWPWGATVIAGIAWVPAAAIGAVARGAAVLPSASVPWPLGVVGVAAAVVVSAAVVVAVLAPAAIRSRLLLVAAVVVAIGVASTSVPTLLVRAGLPAGWSVAACDVGQGDATLLRSGDSTALVDVGDDPVRLQRCLDLLGVHHVDLLVLTHFDRDHVGAVDTVAGISDVALVGVVGRPADQSVVRDLVGAGVDVRRADDHTAGTLGALAWRVLWPREGDTTSGNAASIVVTTSVAQTCATCVRATLLGDLDERAQRRLREAVQPGPVDVVKVSHHGSSDQDPGLYRQLAAPVGLIGVGADNTYGHPTARTLDMLAAAGTTPFRTDRQGTIVVRRGADGPEVWTERQDAPAVVPSGPAASGHIVPVTSARAVSGSARRLGSRTTGRTACPPRSPFELPRRSTRSRGRASVPRPSSS